MEIAATVTYQGQAMLIPKSDGRDYPCQARVRVYHDIPDLGGDRPYIRDAHRWDADITGDLLTDARPPYGEATLRLPDGSTGDAMFQATAPRVGSLTWDGALTGLGRSPTE
ncbi:hypothetical protein FXF51_06070 [Nonomuraea sp. PA05]|uniref:hypothetical protein n=1 Tax=Nonomuraea sp. PA05 TaxID=2604466 RepID=UPI0011D42878|nr:hypothetical protein [Nonomuraea sp. PA05]TYB69726.1 hypothetical protein FXF51_06070 [Nonomuraea sp. PA05]